MSDELIRTKELLTLVPVSRVTLWRWCRSGAFPPPVRMSGSSKAWVRAEVDAWIEARKRARQ